MVRDRISGSGSGSVGGAGGGGGGDGGGGLSGRLKEAKGCDAVGCGAGVVGGFCGEALGTRARGRDRSVVQASSHLPRIGLPPARALLYAD